MYYVWVCVCVCVCACTIHIHIHTWNIILPIHVVQASVWLHAGLRVPIHLPYWAHHHWRWSEASDTFVPASGPRFTVNSITARPWPSHKQFCFILFYDALIAKPWRPNDIHRSSNFQITRTEELYKGSFILSMILQGLCILASTRLDSSTFKLGFPNLPVVPARSMLLTEDMSIQPGQIGIFRRHLLHCDSFDGRTM